MSKAKTKKEIELIEESATGLSKITRLGIDDSILVISKALEGCETNVDEIEKWLNNRFIPNCVEIEKNDYALMCVNALKTVFTVAATDYGSSRQRDLGQLWSDMIRGYLGEIAFQKFLKQKWNIESEIDHEKGELSRFLPMDIHKIKLPGKNSREPKLKISIKTTKWNGIWLDIPGDQFNHSDIHVFVKVGVGRDHLFAFFKEISVFRDKVLKIGEDVGSLTKQESNDLFDSLPSFAPITAYVCGFADKNKKYSFLSYGGSKGRINYTISKWNGPIRSGDKELIKRKEGVGGTIKFSGIGDFNHDQGFLFNSGNLLWAPKDWKSMIERL